MAAARYVLDKSSSKFTVRAFASGMLSSFGHNPTFAIRDFSGGAGFDQSGQASIQLQIRADSLEVMDDIKSKDRREMESVMNEKVLESARFPSILFESSDASMNPIGEGRYQVDLKGDLTLHGVSRPMNVSVQVMLQGQKMTSSGEFSLLQTDYDIPLVSVAGGALRLKDEVTLAFNIIARKEE
jgi:polyisoprenoid-binding protein YceI